MLHPYLDAFYPNTQLRTSTGDFYKTLNGACFPALCFLILLSYVKPKKFDVKDVR